MCDGVSAGLAVAAIAGGAMKAAGSIQQGQQQKAIDYSNANLEDQAAGDAKLRGLTAAGQVRMRSSAQIGQQEAQVGASGVAAAGSPMQVISDQRWLSELDAQTVEANAGREAIGDETKAGNLRTAGDQAETAGNIGAAGDLIGAASQALQFGSRAGWFSPDAAAVAPIGGGTTITEEWAGEDQPGTQEIQS